MLTVSYWIDHRAPNGGVRERTEGAERACNLIDKTTVSTNSDPLELPSRPGIAPLHFIPHLYRETCNPVFIATLFTTARR